MVHYDVGDVRFGAVRGDRDDGNRDINLRRGIQEQEAVDGALDQHARVFQQKLGPPVMAGGEVEVFGAGELFDDTAHDAGEVAFAEIEGEDADTHAATLAQ